MQLWYIGTGDRNNPAFYFEDDTGETAHNALPTALDDVLQLSDATSGSVTCGTWNTNGFACNGAGTITCTQFQNAGPTSATDSVTITGDVTSDGGTIGTVQPVVVNGNLETAGTYVDNVTVGGVATIESPPYPPSNSSFTRLLTITVDAFSVGGLDTFISSNTFNSGFVIVAAYNVYSAAAVTTPSAGNVKTTQGAFGFADIPVTPTLDLTNLSAGNIKKGVTIGGVTGTLPKFNTTQSNGLNL